MTNGSYLSTPKAYVTRALAAYAIHCHPDLPVVYINNPKAACSTVKASLSSYFDEKTGQKTFIPGRGIHSKSGKPFLSNLLDEGKKVREGIVQKPLFSIARNPYSRLLSAYYHKILASDPPVLDWFCERFFLRRKKISGKSVPLSLFLKLLVCDDPLLLNAHFRPQSVNLMLPYAELDFLGHVENMATTKDYLADHGIPLVTANISPPNYMDEVTQQMDATCTGLLCSLYRADFEGLGYDPGSGIFAPPIGKPVPGTGLGKMIVEDRFEDQRLAPELSFMLQFQATPDPKAKLALAVGTNHAHKNRNILRTVHSLFVREGEVERAKQIWDYYCHCLTDHLRHVEDPSIIDRGAVDSATAC